MLLASPAPWYWTSPTRGLAGLYLAAYLDPTGKLLRAMACDPKGGRAEAMRCSMLTLIDKGQPHEGPPGLAASFVVMGEGAVGR